ncbi:1-acyl-sn-glycerol-3-phosphate acyltransferase [Desulforamulus reducens MI-1]|uniref:1-acyl-sn-glycerol-3-phosphate acyltransferase n=1 Tax=Desulforamulus reducens (strain ATCC BAA-1160 / DSM 100696 / MI-1) TaxID=349161 RepID=A4J3N4_DESRM|nr:lysophospholipid acyltransferase family protein [Desulforamulus reducens]ABO49687.1 1-acyl-sn-glycerol-3-phosphate acyltransferase [Desulforamulus reducens MI-1]
MLYTTLRFIIRYILLIWRRWKIVGRDNLPVSGGVLVVSNHVSNLDPLVVGCALTRRIHFMAKVELFKIPILASLIRMLGAFPVNRERSDRKAIRMALEYLQNGEVVGIFPEGTRSKTGELQKAQIGAAMLAVKSNTPILPVALIGTRGIFNKVVVKIGEPLYIPELWRSRASKEQLEALSEQVMKEIERLINNQ